MSPPLQKAPPQWEVGGHGDLHSGGLRATDLGGHPLSATGGTPCDLAERRKVCTNPLRSAAVAMGGTQWNLSQILKANWLLSVGRWVDNSENT